MALRFTGSRSARAFAAGLVLLLTAGCAGGSSSSPGTTATSGSSASSKAGKTSAGKAVPTNPSDLPTIKESQLPKEAKQTLKLIRAGGPFPYERDGVHFGNYEKVLPVKKGSYYKEYTVKTPGTSSRGAKRIIVGNGSEKYFTTDHYETFKFIQEGQ